MGNNELRDMITEVVTQVIAEKLGEKCSFDKVLLYQLSQQFAETQEPLVAELVSQRQDIKSLVDAMRDLQNGFEKLCEVISENQNNPDNGDLWKHGGDSE